jgi:glycosyltransferase involved in cell wall biosynthesis
MKVCYIYREKERKAHSIELLFDKISENVKASGIEVEKWYKPVSNLKAIFVVRKLQADVYHITGDCYFLSLFLPWNRTIMTIHDIGMYKNHPKTLKSRIFALVSFILPLKLLRFSTAISELTKQDLVKILGINPTKIKVIRNPLVLPLKFMPKLFNQKCPTILQIGTGEHKNLIGLIKAVKDMNCYIDIIGRPSQDLITLMNNYNLNYQVSSNLSNDEILEKYHNCDLVYFASYSEGFGLPILEAQATGRPVITSDREPMKTICSNGGALVNPDNHGDISKAINHIMSDENYRRSLIENGLANVKRFDINDIVNQYIETYHSI